MVAIGGNERTDSLITGCEIEDIYTLKDFPIHMLTDEPASNDLCCDMTFSIGKEDGFIELRKIISPEILYKDTHSNAIGKTWRESHELVARLIQNVSTSNTTILEIGGGTGRLNQIFNSLNGTCAEWTIIEPQPCPVDGCTATFIKGFFPQALNNIKYDIILHTHSLEHMENIWDYFNHLNKHIKLGGRMIFSIPDMKPMLQKNMTSIINFEHTFLLLEEYVDYLLGRNGYVINEKIHYGDGHSLIYSTTYLGGGARKPAAQFIRNKQKGLYELY